MKRKNYYLPDQLLTLLRKKMKAEGLSASEIVRRALEAYERHRLDGRPRLAQPDRGGCRR